MDQCNFKPVSTWLRRLLTLSSLLVLSSCGGGGTSSNSKPIANAGPDMSYYIGEKASADGSNSYDPDGDRLSFVWYYVSAPIPFSDLNAVDFYTPAPYFIPDTPGIYTFALQVNDGEEYSDFDNVNITVLNHPPTANAGTDQVVPLPGTVSLDGSSSYDVDGQSLNYQWNVLSSPNDIPVTLTSTSSPQTTFTPIMGGYYELSLIVDDGFDASPIDTVLVEITESIKTVPSTTVEIEPNNTPTSSDPISINVSATGQLNSSYDIDWFEITTPAAGKISIELSSDGPYVQFRNNLQIYNESHKLIANVLSSGGTYSFGTDKSASFLVRITKGLSYRSENYFLQPNFSTDPSNTAEIEPNNSSTSSNDIFSTTVMLGQLYDESDEDWYSLNLTTGDIVTLDITTTAPYSSFSRFSINVIDPSNATIATKEIYGYIDTPLVFQANSPGIYFIQTTSGTHYSTEMYQISTTIN